MENLEMFYVDGEPDVVKDTRLKILSEFSDLEFIEEGHIYYLHGKQLNSVSGIGHRFDPEPFDSQLQAELYAKKHGNTPAHWLQQWECHNFCATTLGTKTHEFGESMGYLRVGHPEFIRSSVKSQYLEKFQYLAPIHKKEEAVIDFMDKLPACYHLVLNEAKVYSGKNPDASKNLKEQICGTFDMLYYFDGYGDEQKAGFIVMDYKTNKKLLNADSRKYGKMLLEPFDDLFDEDLGYYTIQLSLYALMLEDIGLKILDRKVIWLKDDGKFEKISVPDVSERLREVL